MCDLEHTVHVTARTHTAVARKGDLLNIQSSGRQSRSMCGQRRALADEALLQALQHGAQQDPVQQAVDETYNIAR